jgi:class 3 adenylate cyclase
MLTFPEAENAITTAMNILHSVRAANAKLPEARSIHLRMGVHLGQINIDSQGDRIGTSANFAARIESAKLEQLKGAEDLANVHLPERDRVLVSEVVSDEIKANPAFKLRAIGYFEFKGISGLHRIFEVTAAETAS